MLYTLSNSSLEISFRLIAMCILLQYSTSMRYSRILKTPGLSALLSLRQYLKKQNLPLDLSVKSN
jgi:hypothetical protein